MLRVRCLNHSVLPNSFGDNCTRSIYFDFIPCLSGAHECMFKRRRSYFPAKFGCMFDCKSGTQFVGIFEFKAATQIVHM